VTVCKTMMLLTGGLLLDGAHDVETAAGCRTARSSAAAGLQGNEQTVLLKLPKLKDDVGEQNLSESLAAAEADSRQPLLLAEMGQLNLGSAAAAAASKS